MTRSTDESAIGWGIVGPGSIAREFADDARDAGIRLVAVASRSVDRAEAFAREHGIDRAYGSTEELLDDPGVDVVYIATPHRSHAENAIACLRAGKHVLVEKPFTASRAEAREVADVAAETGLLAQEAMRTRFLPGMVRVRELLRAGELGEIRTVSADFSMPLPQDAVDRILDPAGGGGALFDLGVYPLSFASSVLGAPDRMAVDAVLADTGLDRRASVLLGYDRGAQALLSIALDTTGTNRAAIVGERARIEIDPLWISGGGFRLIDPDGRVLESHDGAIEGNGLRYEALAVESAMRAGRTGTGTRTDTDELPVRESVEIMGTLEALGVMIAALPR